MLAHQETGQIQITSTRDMSSAQGLFHQAFPYSNEHRLYLAMGQAGAHGLLAHQDDIEAPVGFAILSHDEHSGDGLVSPWLYYLAVAKDSQLHDIGSALLRASEQIISDSAHDHLSLISSIGAITFYEKQGYEMVDVDERLMTKVLR